MNRTIRKVTSDGVVSTRQEHVNKPVPNSTPEAAMDELLSKARFVFGDQPWQEWSWEAREYGSPQPKRITFAYRDGAFIRSQSLG